MNDKPKGRTLPKQRLSIVNCELDVPYSQGTKFLDRVQAVNLSLAEDDPLHDKPLRMTIFNGDLKTFVRGKTDIIADVEERPRPDSEYGPDRTIVQVYDDQGQPVSRKQGGGGYRRSLEDDLVLEGVKRRSIEGQTAVAQVGALLTSPSDVNLEELALDAETWSRILGKYWKAVEKGLDNYLADPPPQAAKTTQASASKPRQAAQDKRRAAPPSDKVSEDKSPPADPVKHVGDLLTRANKVGVTPAEVGSVCGVTKPAEIKDLDEAWKKVQEFAKSKGKGFPAGDDGKTTEQAWDDMKR